MKISKNDLEAAQKEGIISNNQVENLITFLQKRSSTTPRFDFTHILYYMGGLLAIGAMSLFMNLGWESFGGWGIVAISLIYAAIGLKLASVFERRGYGIPAGICATFVIALTPLAIYGLQQGLGVWPDDTVYRDYHRYIKWHWLIMELGTLAVAAVIAKFYRYSFLIMPVAVTLWYMSMDVAAWLAMAWFDETWANYELRKLVSMYFGIAMILFAFWVDIRSRSKVDYGFWLYIFGVLAFWGGMTMQHSDNELSKFIYFCINLGLIGVGVVLVRKVFVVFGGLGCTVYIGHLAYDVFEDSLLFPFALTGIGLLVIYSGVVWQKREKAVTAKVHGLLPDRLRELLESRRF